LAPVGANTQRHQRQRLDAVSAKRRSIAAEPDVRVSTTIRGEHPTVSWSTSSCHDPGAGHDIVARDL